MQVLTTVRNAQQKVVCCGRHATAASAIGGARFGPLSVQTLFAERTDWHVPWLERVLPIVTRQAEARRARTIFTRFMPPERPEEAAGAWRRYYRHWRKMTGEQLVIPGSSGWYLTQPAGLCHRQKSLFPVRRGSFSQDTRQVRADTFVMTGGETDVCVLAAVMDAVDAGYRVVLADDALCSVSASRTSRTTPCCGISARTSSRSK